MNKKPVFIFILILMLQVIPSKSLAHETGLLNSTHMKQFNIFEKDQALPKILLNFNQEKIYVITEVIFQKNENFDTDILKNVVNIKKGSQINRKDIEIARENLTHFYHSNGYRSAIINISTAKAEEGIINFSIYEGPKDQMDPNKLVD